MEIEEKIKQILAVTLDLEQDELGDYVSSENIPNWDSLQQMNIIVALEDEFKIRFEEAESILLKDYTSLLNAVAEKTSS